jgi:ABC-type uncharacterized transport system auxiliary subunit
MKTLIAAAASACLAGCVSLLPAPAPPSAIYTLRAANIEAIAGAPKPVVVAVGQPSAPRSVGGADIVWRQGAQIAFMEGAAWDGAAPDLLQDLLIDVIDRRNGVRAVVRGGAGVRADAEVRWSILSFEVLENGARLEAAIETTAQLIDLRSRAVLADERFNARAPISTRSGRAAAAALERVANEAALLTADWAIRTVEPPQPSAASTSR